MKQTYLKSISVLIKLSPNDKSPAVNTASVASIVNPTTYGKDKGVYLDKSPFEVDSIMTINGRDLDGYICSRTEILPTFYGIMEKTTLLDNIV